VVSRHETLEIREKPLGLYTLVLSSSYRCCLPSPYHCTVICCSEKRKTTRYGHAGLRILLLLQHREYALIVKNSKQCV
jgi:hypothetical protein